jgi:hypothetical protein
MQPVIRLTRAAKAIAIKPGQRIGTAALQFSSEHIFGQLHRGDTPWKGGEKLSGYRLRMT